MDQTLDDAFRALADTDRRRLLTALAARGPQPDDIPVVSEDVPSEDTQRERLRIQRYHTDIPKLEAAGLVNWDRDAHQVTKGPQFDEIRPILKVLADEPDELAPHE